MSKLVIIGGKGNGTVVAAAVHDMAAAGGDLTVEGILDDAFEVGDTIDGFPVLGKTADAARMDAPDRQFFFGIQAAKQCVARYRVLKSIGLPPERYATIVHPSAVVSRNVTLGHGVAVLAQTFVGPNAVLDDFAFVHGQCYVARDTHIERYGYMAPKAYLGAGCRIEKGGYLGVGAKVREYVDVGAWSVVGMGSVVVKPVPEYAVQVGVPAATVETLDDRWDHDD